MRTFKILIGLFAVLAFSAVAVATASAAETLWKLLPGAEKTAVTSGGSGKATLRAKGQAAIECEKSKVSSGELTSPATDATLLLLIIVFEKCSSLGLTATGLGDAAGNITSHVEAHTCVISGTDRGLILEPLPTHFEVTAAARLVVVTGSAIGLVEPLPTDLKHWELSLLSKAKNFEQGIEKCEGGVKRTLLASVQEATPVESSEEALEGLLVFASAQDPT